MFSNIIALLTAACAGISVGCAAFIVLRSLGSCRLEHRDGEELRSLPLLFRMLLPLTGLTRGAAASESCRHWCETASRKLWQSGYGDTVTPQDFVALEILFFLCGAGFILCGAGSGTVFLPLLIGVLLIIYPKIWLNATIKKRHIEIMKALPNVLDLLTLSVESGKDLVSSLRDILGRRKNDALGEELTRCFHEMQLGRQRSEALRSMADRVRQSDLTSTVNAIIQAEELGVGIAQLLRIQSDMQRNKRFAMAEELANQAAVKIIFPVVIFILPAVFIILLGPLALQTARMFR